MKQKKRGFTFILIIILIICNILPNKMVIAAQNTKKITVNGNINYFIEEDGSKNAIMTFKQLNNYPFTLVYENMNGKKSRLELQTDSAGAFHTTIETVEDIKNIWTEIRSENDACLVTAKKFLRTNHFLSNQSYKFTSKKTPVNMKKSVVNMNISITGNDTAKGAINIARVINNARDFMKNETGLDIRKIKVYWTNGRGVDSFVISPGTGMFLAGKDHDERDESVISHEYGHWVYGTLRGEGKFMGGSHSGKDELKKQLAYSEGLATFFGQMVLNSAEYVDGNITTGSIYDDIESPTKIFKNYYQNEIYVAASIWDIIDNYLNNTENWDKVADNKKDVLQSTIDVVMNAGYMDFDILNPIHTTMSYDCYIKDFYDQYVDSYVTKNSTEALDFWTIYNKNGMQFDDEDPKIELKDTVGNDFVVVNSSRNSIRMELYDNVKVSKIEFHINGKPAGTYQIPPNTFYYPVPMNMLKNGTNKLAIKVYDYAGRYTNKDSDISKAFPANDFYKASLDSDDVNKNFDNVAYRKPYEIKYVDLLFQGENSTLSTFSNNNLHNLNNVNELDSSQAVVLDNIEELADIYSLQYKDNKFGNLSRDQVSPSCEIAISSGEDYAIFTDDTLGDFEITLTDPQGNEYSNSKEPEQYLTEDESKTGAILNLGSSGLMLFNPVPGTWTYAIKNRGTTADYAIGIYTKPSAPIILNEDELLKIQDGSLVELRASISTNRIPAVTGSAISVTTGSAITAVTGSAVSIKLTGEHTGVVVQDIIQDTIDAEGNFIYKFVDLTDDHYTVELYVTDGEGHNGWKKEGSIIVDSAVPDILLEDDYEYYTYPGKAMIEGKAINSSKVTVYLNGTEVPIYGSGGNHMNFATDYMELNIGNNTVLIVAETETGRRAVKELTLYSQPEEECLTEEHEPVIERVLFNGQEEAFINQKSTIEVKLTDSNVKDYKVFAIFNDKQYDFIPEGDHFVLDMEPEEGSGNYQFIIYAVSRWQMLDYKELGITIIGEDGGIYLIKQPDDVTIQEGEKVVLNIDEIFGGTEFQLESNLGEIKERLWSFTPELPGVYEINLKAIKGETEVTASFYIIVKPSVGFNLKLDANGGTLSNNTYFIYYNQKYGVLPTPTRKGYTFQGWFTDPVEGSKVTADTIANEDDSRTLYAHWKGIDIQVGFNPNGGSVNQATKMVVYGDPYGTLPLPTRENFFFLGWYTASKGGTKINEDTIVSAITNHSLYAQWSSKTYTINLAPCGGSVSKTSKQVTYGDSYGTLPSPYRAGYTFIGWYTKEEAGEEITEITEVTLKNGHTLYAHWKPIQYNIYFNGNGGSVSEDLKKVNYGESYGELPVPERKDHYFKGWYTSPSGGSLISSESIVNITTSTMLYARWSGNPSQVTFDPNGGSVATTSKDVTYGSIYGSLPVPNKDGYIFEGWYLSDNDGIKIESTTRVNFIDDHTLYAHWTTSSYSIVFDDNDGSTSKKYKSIMYGEKYGSLRTPTRNGYTFIGWFTSANGDGEQVTPSTVHNVASNKNIYAHWKPNEYTIRFRGNGGKVDRDNIKVTYGNIYGELPTPVLDHYTFEGWYNSNGYLIQPSHYVNVTMDQVLSAGWKGNQFTIDFDSNGGSTVSPIKVNYGNNYGSLPTPYRMGYVFLGWLTSPKGEEMVTYYDTVRLEEDQTLYARWDVMKPSVTFNGNGGDMIVNGEKTTSSIISLTYGEKYGNLPIPTREGYSFLGWYLQGTTDVKITSDTIVTLTSSHSLYASWSANSYIINFDTCGGNLLSNSMKVTYDNYYGNLPVPEKANYTFTGWFTKPEGGELIKSSSTVKLQGNQILYAHWQGISSIVNFDNNIGYPNYSRKVVYYGSTYGTLPVPTRTGYDFAGWFTASSGGGKIDETAIVDYTIEHTLYAHWSPKKVIVSLNPNYNSESISTKVVLFEERYGYLPTLTRAGYRFKGWYTSPTGDVQVVAEDLVKASTDFTLYAQWEGNSYNVFFDANGGSIATTSGVVTNGRNHNGALVTPTRPGYSFDGWYTERSGGSLITLWSVVDTISSYTLYAHWTQEVYRITYFANGGNLSSSSTTTVYIGQDYSDFPIPTREGYSFEGWYTSSDTNVTRVYSVSQACSLYAHWKQNKYTVSFEENGGTVYPSTKEVLYGSLYGELPTPTKEGYSFGGWLTEDGKAITSNTSMNRTKNHTLTAQWNSMRYEITYDSNGGNQFSAIKYAYYGGEYGSHPVPTRNGYNFIGWFTAPSGGNEITSSSILQIKNNHVLYAHWTPIKPVITFYANGGRIFENGLKVHSTSAIKTYGERYGDLPEPIREGYIFNGWFTYSNGGVRIQEDNMVEVVSNSNLFAQWTGISNKVSFDSNGGSNINETIDVIYGNPYGTLPIPTRTGYNFTGWFTEKNNGTFIAQNTVVGILNNQTLYAHWNKSNYYITLNGNGGYMYVGKNNVATTSKLVTYSETYGALPTPTRYGYIFEGWYTEVIGGQEITQEKDVFITEQQTLYAHWREIILDVWLYEDCGEPLSEIIKVEYNGTYGYLPTPTREYYTFKGWYYGNQQILSDTKVTSYNTHTLYAKWEPNTYKVTLEPNGGSVTQTSIDVAYEGTYNILPNPTREDYYFIGWYDSLCGGNRIYSNSIMYKPSDMVLYARWKENNHKITFNVNGYEQSKKDVISNQVYGELPVPTLWGYNFIGWYTDSLEGDIITETDKIIINKPHTLYARFKVKTPTIIFHANGGKVENATKIVAYNSKYGELPVPSLSYYTFDGWYNSATGGARITESTIVNVMDTQALYAHWIPATYTIEFDPNGGNVSTASKTVTYESTYGALPAPSKIGSTFLGWYTDLTGGVQITSTSVVKIKSSQKVYARWK
ncbi:MAG: InlB B-repeat-containing protein [Anaerocolumna aminovalerica]|uniref:InlB B-repeat-containing protein n=1 Tax=Anaerocolumna aminovalerica TaxID=1527 RepID=UPI002910D16A|nr:InlB B-repeat-containing protein [Anaerocolumna aminovalerica]MDU6265410.1 InlB B-repeat-containing protein [Anaerocolumna aminovalerica]